MLFNRHNFSILGLASKDPYQKGLNGIRLEPDGTTVAGNGRALLAVSPASEENVHFPESAAERTEPGSEGIVLEPESAEKVLKSLSRDRRVSLQHFALTKLGGNRIGFTSLNPKGETTVTAALPKPPEYPDWKKVLRKVRGNNAYKVCVSRSDLSKLLAAMEKACGDSKDADPVFLEVSPEGLGIVARGINRATGQRVAGAVAAYKMPKGYWPEDTSWEKRIFSTARKIARKLSPSRKRRLRRLKS